MFLLKAKDRISVSIKFSQIKKDLVSRYKELVPNDENFKASDNDVEKVVELLKENNDSYYEAIVKIIDDLIKQKG